MNNVGTTYCKLAFAWQTSVKKYFYEFNENVEEDLIIDSRL